MAALTPVPSGPADTYRVTPHQQPEPRHSPASGRPNGADDTDYYGVPRSAFAHAWTIKDVCAYLQIGRTYAYQLMAEPGAPRPLRLSRARRWNGKEVVAWQHSIDDGPAVTLTAVRDDQHPAARTALTPAPVADSHAPPDDHPAPQAPARPVPTGAQAAQGSASGQDRIHVVIDPDTVQSAARAERIRALATPSRRMGPVQPANSKTAPGTEGTP